MGSCEGKTLRCWNVGIYKNLFDIRSCLLRIFWESWFTNRLTSNIETNFRSTNIKNTIIIITITCNSYPSKDTTRLSKSPPYSSNFRNLSVWPFNPLKEGNVAMASVVKGPFGNHRAEAIKWLFQFQLIFHLFQTFF